MIPEEGINGLFNKHSKLEAAKLIYKGIDILFKINGVVNELKKPAVHKKC